MSEVFEGYERQYCEFSSNLSQRCSSASLLDGEKKKQKITEIQSGIDDAESLIRKMDLEARSLQPSVKATLLAKLREYKSDLNNLKSEVKKLSSASLSARDELLDLEAGISESDMASSNQRGRLAMSTERLNQSSDRIKESRRVLLETEDIGVRVIEDLHNQRQALLNSQKRLHEVDDFIGKSKKLLTSMSKRMNRNKYIIGSVIAALVVAILFILYFKLSH